MTFTGRTSAVGFLPRRAESSGHDIAAKRDPLSRKRRDRGRPRDQIISDHTYVFPDTIQRGVNNSVRSILVKRNFLTLRVL